MSTTQDPSYILEIGAGYWKSKVLLTAVGFGVFTLLGDREMTGTEIGNALNLQPRGIWDFLDALVGHLLRLLPWLKRGKIRTC